ncbi:rhamnan synthesis F family protein [Albidovulum sediminis]|nr:rhamnan synthesis F family protein [Defluviimonas sediminis]
MMPLWKLKREVRRVALQVSQVQWLVYGPALRRIHDFRKARRIRLHHGAHALSGDVAVVLIYQPQGLSGSLFHTLRHLTGKGFAPLVVSNAPLSAEDVARLKPHCAAIMERPNYGYDFGGYRDGILHLLDHGTEIGRVLVMNDSIWFPLYPDCDLIDRMRRADDDLYGYVMNARVNRHRSHLQSYFFAFGKRLVATSDFRNYWAGLFVTSNKNLVIRRCEIPMTEHFRARGYSIGYRYLISDPMIALRSLTPDELMQVVRYQMRVDTSNAATLAPYAAGDPADPAWRTRVMALAGDLKMGKYLLIAHPLLMLGKLRGQILKKDRQPMYRLQRAELLAGGFAEGMAPAVLEEVMTCDGVAHRLPRPLEADPGRYLRPSVLPVHRTADREVEVA